MPANIEPATFFCFMKPHHFFDIEWINFPKTKKAVRGCYLIGYHYVGASKHIRNRVISHLRGFCCPTTGKLRENCLDTILGEYVTHCIIKKEKIKVTFLSYDTSDEEKFYKEYDMPIYPSTTFYNQIFKDEVAHNVKPKKL